MSAGTLGRPPTLGWRGSFSAIAGMQRDRANLMSRLAQENEAVRLPFGTRQLYYFCRAEHAQHVLTHNADNYVKGIGQSHARRALGDGLLTNEGEDWKSARSTMRPLFARSQAAHQTAVVAQQAFEFTQRLNARAQAGSSVVELRHALTDFTIRVLGPALIGHDLTRYPRLGPAFDIVQGQAIFEMLTLNLVPHGLPTRRRRRFLGAMRYLESVVDDLVARAHQAGGEDDNLVSAILRESTSRQDPRRRVRDELVTMLLAGHETTASTLTWALHLVAGHPDVCRRVRQEAMTALADTVEAEPERLLDRLPYTLAVVHEVIRLYPAVWLLSRKALADDEIGGYAVPAGTDVLICPYALHRDARYWEVPEEFRPERFMGGFPAESRYAYIPFGAGPRSCIGRNLGLAEAAVALARICRDVEFSIDGDGPGLDAMLTLRPKAAVRLRVHPDDSRGPASNDSAPSRSQPSQSKGQPSVHNV